MQNMQFFDTHCHLDLPELAADLFQHWSFAQSKGVSKALIPAVEASRWPLLLKLKDELPELEIAFGIHPWWVQNADDAQLIDLERNLANSAVCAVGEIGLDFSLDWHPDPSQIIARQIALFRDQLAIAQAQRRPVILHHRKSQPQLIEALKAAHFTQGGILHAFSGSQAQAYAFLDLGFKLGVGGTITYERAQKTRENIRKLPLSALVLETDAPAMPLAGFQGQFNTPSQLARVFEMLCNLRPEPSDQIAHQLWQNSFEAVGLTQVVAIETK